MSFIASEEFPDAKVDLVHVDAVRRAVGRGHYCRINGLFMVVAV